MKEPIPFQPTNDSNALPESITQFGASDVTAPEGSLPTTAGETGEVTSPEDATTPQVGITPGKQFATF